MPHPPLPPALSEGFHVNVECGDYEGNVWHTLKHRISGHIPEQSLQIYTELSLPTPCQLSQTVTFLQLNR